MSHHKRTETVQQKQWKQQYKIISRKQEDSQKSFIKILSSLVNINPENSEKFTRLISEQSCSDVKLEKESARIYEKLKKINEAVGELKETLKYFDKTNQSLLKVQRLSENAIEKMDAMKLQMGASYDELEDSQIKLSKQLELYERRIDAIENGQSEDWQQENNQRKLNVASVQRGTKKEIKKVEQRSVQRESQRSVQRESEMSKMEVIEIKMKNKENQVAKVDEQIREMGKNLGWHQEDHKDFVTIWNRSHEHKNYFQIQDELTQYFKVYTGEQIRDHMNKYVKLKKILEKKKQLINQYKDLKESKKMEELIKLQSNEYENQKRLKKEEERKRMEEEQKQMKEKVQNWKKIKEQEKLMEKKRLEEEQQKKRREEVARKREEEVKRRQILEKWKEEKEKEEEKQKEKETMKKSTRRPQSAVNKETINRIRERQEQIMKEKMEMIILKKMEREELEKKAEKMKEQKMIKYAHVNSKLEEKTTAIKQKQRQKFDGKDKKEANTFGGQLLMTGVRAIPSWRQGL